MALVAEGSVLCGYNSQKAMKRNAHDVRFLGVCQTSGMKGVSATSPCKLCCSWSSHCHTMPDRAEATEMDAPDNSCHCS